MSYHPVRCRRLFLNYTHICYNYNTSYCVLQEKVINNACYVRYRFKPISTNFANPHILVASEAEI